MAKVNNSLTKSLILLIRAYSLCISPFLGHCCRFTPSCSSYTIKAIQYFGCCRGIMLSFKRIIRCHPWQPGGYDPVPDTFSYVKN